MQLCSIGTNTAVSIFSQYMLTQWWSSSLAYTGHLEMPMRNSSTAHIVQDTFFVDGSKQKCTGCSHTQAKQTFGLRNVASFFITSGQGLCCTCY